MQAAHETTHKIKIGLFTLKWPRHDNFKQKKKREGRKLTLINNAALKAMRFTAPILTHSKSLMSLRCRTNLK